MAATCRYRTTSCRIIDELRDIENTLRLWNVSVFKADQYQYPVWVAAKFFPILVSVGRYPHWAKADLQEWLMLAAAGLLFLNFCISTAKLEIPALCDEHQ